MTKIMESEVVNATANSRDEVIRLIPAVLAGRWNSGNEKDRAILCWLANCYDYGELELGLLS